MRLKNYRVWKKRVNIRGGSQRPNPDSKRVLPDYASRPTGSAEEKFSRCVQVFSEKGAMKSNSGVVSPEIGSYSKRWMCAGLPTALPEFQEKS